MYQLIVVVHVLLGLGVIGLVLMQQGKGADAGAAFGSGGGASGTVFGAQGAASFLSRTTAIFATLFFSTSLGLAVLSGHQNKTADIMAVPEVEKKVADVPGANLSTPVAEEVPVAVPSLSEQKTPVTAAPLVAPVVPAAVDTTGKVDDNKAEKSSAKEDKTPADKVKAEEKASDHKEAKHKKSEHKDKAKPSDKKDAAKSDKSDKKAEKKDKAKSDKKDKSEQ